MQRSGCQRPVGHPVLGSDYVDTGPSSIRVFYGGGLLALCANIPPLSGLRSGVSGRLGALLESGTGYRSSPLASTTLAGFNTLAELNALIFFIQDQFEDQRTVIIFSIINIILCVLHAVCYF